MALPPKKKRRLSHSPSDEDSANLPGDIEDESDHSPGDISLSGAEDDNVNPVNGVTQDRSDSTLIGNVTTVQPSKTRVLENLSGNQSLKTDSTSKARSRNVFDFQIDNLLHQAQQKSSSNGAEDTLRKLKACLESLPDREPLPLKDAEKSLLSNKIVIPFPNPRPPVDAKYKFGFQKPTYINVVGSYALKTTARLEEFPSVDLILQMPSDLFTEKDYLNHRYFHKRAFYLACIAHGINSSDQFALDLSYSFLNGNHLLPVIVLQPTNITANGAATLDSNWKVQVLLAADSNLFSPERTLPNKNCVRPPQPTNDQDSQIWLPPTPFYNGSLRVDCSMTGHLKLLHEAASRCSEFRPACHLGRIWLKQRGFNGNLEGGGFGHFEWAVLMAILLRDGGPQGRRVLSPTYNAQQLFKATVQFLAMKNLSKQPMPFDTQIDISKLQYSGPLILEGFSGSNLLYKMTPWSYDLLRQEAQHTVKMINSHSPWKFESTFIWKVSEPLVYYDLVVSVSGIELPASTTFISFLTTLQEFHDFLSHGLNGRVSQLNVSFPSQEPWPINTARTDRLSIPTLMIYIVVDPVAASRTVDRGPPAEDSAAVAKFQGFWGEKAELRRFKDGQILQSVVWNGNGPIEITKTITKYLVHRHFGEKAERMINFYGNDSRTIDAVTQGLLPDSDISKEYLKLEQQIRSLDGLPLQVRQIQRSAVTSNSKHPVDVVLQFEESGRWPDDLEAIQITKVAFFLKLQQLLGTRSDIQMVRIGIENSDPKLLNRSFLDVFYTTAGCFRIRIHHDRELTLLERKTSDKTLPPSQKQEAAAALSSYKRTFVRKPFHTQSMIKIFTRLPALNETLRLVKAWFRAHLLANHFHSELIDLLTAANFLGQQPWLIPSSPQTGFLRTLLFISKWDWQNDPLIVDFGSSMKSADYDEIRTRFEAWRKIDPLMNRVAPFVATDFDPEGEIWTENGPSKLVAARMVNLAQAACRVVKEKGVNLDLSLLFKKSLKDYDFVLRLADSAGARHKTTSNRNVRFKNLQIQEPEDIEDIGFDPVALYLTELQALYGDSVVFFYGEGTDVIAGLWSPHTARRAWKVNLSYSTIPLGGASGDDSTGPEVIINKSAMLAEMARLGGDMISGVEHRR